jgi:glycosyltransferase involved in cell wall biosynthesis
MIRSTAAMQGATANRTRESDHPAAVWLLCELYDPELTATGWYVTGLARGLADEFDMHVICARPNYSARGVRLARDEHRGGVKVHRCATPVFNRDRLLRRAAGGLLQALAMSWAAWRRVRRGDTLVVVTNPPVLPYLGALVARLRGARCLLYIHDLYPDAMVCAGLLAPAGLLARLLHALAGRLYAAVDHIVTDGRDAQSLVTARVARTGARTPVDFIAYWGEAGLDRPPRQAPDFVVQYSGNMGRLHELPTLLRAAAILRDHPTVRWLFRGGGARHSEAVAFVREEGLGSKLHFRPACDWDGLGDALAEGDVGIVALVRGAAGVATPSRMYNLLAAGRPIIAVADADTELALMVREHDVGWVVPPGDASGLAKLLARLADDRGEVWAAGRRALDAATRYRRELSVAAFASVLRDLGSRQT